MRSTSSTQGPICYLVLLVGIILCGYLVLSSNLINNTIRGVLPKITNPCNSTENGVNKPTKEIVEMYKRQASERKRMYRRGEIGIASMYNNMAPEVFCAEEIKVGTTDDGGKWMCGPYNLPDNCTIFSLGLNNQITYEVDLQNMTNQRCRVIGIDQNDQNSESLSTLRNIRGTATKAKISKETNESIGKFSLPELMKMHNVAEIEIFKIDIEGAEFDVLPDFLSKHRVSQILIEIHGEAVSQTVSFLKMISSHGYLLFHYEINGGRHEFAEYAFIHESVLERYHATLLARYLDR